VRVTGVRTHIAVVILPSSRVGYCEGDASVHLDHP
jgi:hypothetical protein